MRLTALPVLLAAAACATASAPAPQYQSIAFEMASWGRPIDSWSIGADGSALYVEMTADDGAPFGRYRLEHRAFMVAPADFARLAAMAEALPRLRRDACKLRATDFPYGRLRLAEAGAIEDIPFDTGCRDAPYQAFVAQLRAMDEQVAAWAKAHPVTHVERQSEP